jgi:hypothetical protein
MNAAIVLWLLGAIYIGYQTRDEGYRRFDWILLSLLWPMIAVLFIIVGSLLLLFG